MVVQIIEKEREREKQNESIETVESSRELCATAYTYIKSVITFGRFI